MYGATSIKPLRGLDAIRKRPEMYIGNTGDGSGLHSMIYQVLDNGIDEALAGFATEIAVTLNADGSATVRDNGRGMPTDIHPEEGIPAAEVIMTQLHGRGIFSDEGADPNSCKISGSLHAVGVCVVNALSTALELKIWRDGKKHLVRFRNGVAEAPLKVVGPAPGRHGTEVRFWPSLDVFRNVTRFDHATLEGRLRELAFLRPGIRIVLADNRHPGAQQPQSMCYPDGIADFVRYLDRASTPLIDAPIIISGEEADIGVQAALWWNDSFDLQFRCFTNTIPQREGGTHVEGFGEALSGILGSRAYRSACGALADHAASDVLQGLTAVLSVKVPNPRFSGQTNDHLASPEAQQAVRNIVAAQLLAWINQHPEETDLVLVRVIKAAMARHAQWPKKSGLPSLPRRSSEKFWEEMKLRSQTRSMSQAEKDDQAAVLRALREERERETSERLESVRRQPHVHIGDTGDGTGLLNMVYEVLDYAVDEVRSGDATEIAVSLNADGSTTIRHNGLGLCPVIGNDGLSDAEVAATQLLGPGTTGMRHYPYRVPGDLEGEGLAAVNALSSGLEMRIWQEGQEHLVRYRDGGPEAPIAVVGPATRKQGMEITFWPSLEVFHTVTDFDYAALERRLHEVAAFEPGLRIVLDDHRPGGRRQHRICCGGIDGLVHYLDRGRKALIDAPISMRDNGDLLDLELALWWTDTAREQVACYTSTLPQRDGGVHRDGLLAGVSRVIARYAQQHGGAESQRVPIVGADALAGLTAVVTVWMCEPEFADETKSELISPAVKPVVESVVADRLSAWLEAHPRQAQAILAHARKAASGRAVCGFAQRLPAGRL